MSRYSPTVLEQPFDLGGIISQMMEGYYGGRQMKRETRSRKRQEEREMVSRCSRRRQTVTRVRATGRTRRKYSAASSALQTLSSISLAMTREDVHAILQRISTTASKPGRNWRSLRWRRSSWGWRTWPRRKRSLKELRDEMLDEIDAIERELGLTSAIST